MKTALSRAELLALPPATDLRTLGRAFGISEPVARERHRRGEWDALGIRILRLGAQWRVVTADLLRVLGIDPAALPQMSAADASLRRPQTKADPPPATEHSHAERTPARHDASCPWLAALEAG